MGMTCTWANSPFIPKLGVMLTLVSPLKSSLASLTYIVQKNGEALVKLDVPSERIKSGKRERAPTQDPSTRQTTRSHFILPPLTVSEPCTLRASIVADGIEYAACILAAVSNSLQLTRRRMQKRRGHRRQVGSVQHDQDQRRPRLPKKWLWLFQTPTTLRQVDRLRLESP